MVRNRAHLRIHRAARILGEMDSGFSGAGCPGMTAAKFIQPAYSYAKITSRNLAAKAISALSVAAAGPPTPR